MNVVDYAPFVGTIGGGFVAGTLVGYAIKRVLKIAAVIVGLFIAALAYLQYQGIIHVDWAKFQAVSQSGLATITDVKFDGDWNHQRNKVRKDKTNENKQFNIYNQQ